MISPCQKKCKQVNGICRTCKRTMDEIIHWRTYTDEMRQQIMNHLNKR